AALTTLDALYGYLAAARAVPATHRAAAVGMHRLADGRTVTVRPIAPNDADRVRHFLEVTSPQSRYTRFHAFVAAPSATLVHFLTDLDAERGQAFVCAVGASTAEAIVGEARYVATDEPGVCELGILIEDDWQHSGIAGLLMEAVIDGARERGYRTMEGLVLAQNAPMLRFAHALGFALDYLPGDRRTVRIVLDLGTHRAAQPRTSANAGDRCASSDDKR
ncbi:MAG TPA: GNAT family N-acetyltransferase, partial [Casimicrobiaceae bacterium]|nr:GNAT family N-acetyltransferase [Casimicrobiaceae bacterium]